MARTKAQLKKLHRELWQWLADNPNLKKKHWPRWKFNGGDVQDATNQCFACEAMSPQDCGVDEGSCDDCPCFSKNHCELDDGNNPFDMWNETNTTNQKARRKYALLVRDAWK